MEKLIEKLFWIKIFISPVLASAILGLFLYLAFKESIMGIIFPLFIFTIGVVTGYLFAKRATKNRSASDFVAEVNASKDLDNLK